MKPDLVEALRCVIESASQAPHDFCGEQREFHLPRLQRAMVLLMTLFPAEACAAIETAKDPYGNILHA